MRIAPQHQASHNLQKDMHHKRVLEVQRSLAGKTALVLLKVYLCVRFFVCANFRYVCSLINSFEFFYLIDKTLVLSDNVGFDEGASINIGVSVWARVQCGRECYEY